MRVCAFTCRQSGELWINKTDEQICCSPPASSPLWKTSHSGMLFYRRHLLVVITGVHQTGSTTRSRGPTWEREREGSHYDVTISTASRPLGRLRCFTFVSRDLGCPVNRGDIIQPSHHPFHPYALLDMKRRRMSLRQRGIDPSGQLHDPTSELQRTPTPPSSSALIQSTSRAPAAEIPPRLGQQPGLTERVPAASPSNSSAPSQPFRSSGSPLLKDPEQAQPSLSHNLNPTSRSDSSSDSDYIPTGKKARTVETQKRPSHITSDSTIGTSEQSVEAHDDQPVKSIALLPLRSSKREIVPDFYLGVASGLSLPPDLAALQAKYPKVFHFQLPEVGAHVVPQSAGHIMTTFKPLLGKDKQNEHAKHKGKPRFLTRTEPPGPSKTDITPRIGEIFPKICPRGVTISGSSRMKRGDIASDLVKMYKETFWEPPVGLSTEAVAMRKVIAEWADRWREWQRSVEYDEPFSELAQQRDLGKFLFPTVTDLVNGEFLEKDRVPLAVRRCMAFKMFQVDVGREGFLIDFRSVPAPETKSDTGLE